MATRPQTESTVAATVAPPSPETAKDQRRRGAELDMAHKAYDRAKGHFHSRVGRSWCTMCHGRGWSGPERTARAPVSAAYDDVDEARCGPTWAQDVVEYERRQDMWYSYEGLENEQIAPPADTLLCTQCGCAGDAICIPVKAARRRKHKGIAADYEMVPNASHHVRVLEDDYDSERTPQEEWEFVDSDDSGSQAPVRRSYAGVVQGH